MSIAEKGAVGDIDPAFFVGYLHRLKATGTLKFEDAPIQRAIYFREGRVLFSSSNAPEDQLGAILVAGGKISQEQFDGLLASLEPKQSIAAALAQGGFVAQRDIGDAARKKVEQIVGSCCAQTTGRYEFEDGVLPKGALDLKLTTEKVLVNAFEALEPSGFLIRVLKSPMAVLAAADVQPTEPELIRLKEALDGVSSLADIGGAVGLSLPATEVRAAVLVVIGAASVVTSQIEEMALPDTGETTPGLMLDESEPIQADTIAFGLSPTGGDVRFDADSISGSNGSADATLVMGGGHDASADATLVTGSGLDLSPRKTSESGLSWGGPQPKREKASTQDLAAVKELLAAPSVGSLPRPPAASLPSKTWEPVLSTAGRPGRGSRGLAAFVANPMVQRSAAAVVILGLAGVGWLAYTGTQAPPTPAANMAPAPASTPTPAQAPPTSVALTTPPAAASAPLAPPPATRVASPAVAAAISPTPAANVPTKPTPSAPAPTATPKPAVVPTQAAVPEKPAGPAPAASASLAASYQALKAGQLNEAAATAEAIARSRSAEFSLQILVACSPQTIEKALVNDSSTDLFVLPTTISGKPCFRLMRGFFKTSDEATHTTSTLPGYYVAEGAKPRAVQVKAVLR